MVGVRRVLLREVEVAVLHIHVIEAAFVSLEWRRRHVEMVAFCEQVSALEATVVRASDPQMHRSVVKRVIVRY